jgi:CDP-4-dehydro-6-deoxyglucose reductase, E3
MKHQVNGKILETVLAPIVQVRPLTNAIIQVFLQLPSLISYDAGQYLQVITSDGQRVPFSIANANLGSSQVELHIRHTPENQINNQIVSEIQKQGALQITMPLGECTYQVLQPSLPIIFMARGTGFAPIKAIIEQLFVDGCALPMHLYWGARNIGDHYLDELPEKWTEHVENFKYTPLLCPEPSHKSSEIEIPVKWTGRSGDLVDMIALDYYPSLANYQVLAAGPFDMMLQARDVFKKQGLKSENMYADAFSFS